MPECLLRKRGKECSASNQPDELDTPVVLLLFLGLCDICEYSCVSGGSELTAMIHLDLRKISKLWT